MFTGIIRRLGTVAANSGAALKVRGSLGSLPRGASVSVNGVCLTVVLRRGDRLAFDVGPETLRRTTLGALKPGDRVNLEPALRAADLVGGHLVSGHVDARVKVLRRSRLKGGFELMRFALPGGLKRFVPAKGSIAVDGTSLTVSRVAKGFFESMLIPETLKSTTLGLRRPGDLVNVEADLIARYLDALSAKPR